ncbi:MAG: PHP domain-containing protein [Candidatus Kariarchaeaceae archaeon]|jgi:predicted metal-dependent phosphoesterase TrpH
MKLDLHLHSEFSWDSKVKIKEYVNQAQNLGFSAISITDHNSIESHSTLDSLQDKTDVILLPGQEVSTSDGHLLVYGFVDLAPQGLSMKETINSIKGDPICIAAHPFDPFRGGSFSKVFQSGIDGIELLNASSWFHFPNYLASRAYSKQSTVEIGLGNSDSHNLMEFGSAYSVSESQLTLNMENLKEILTRSLPAGSRIGWRRKISRFAKRKLS